VALVCPLNGALSSAVASWSSWNPSIMRLHYRCHVSVSPYRVRCQNNSVYYVLDPGPSSCQGCRCKVRLESTASSQLHRPAKCHGIHPAYVLSVAPHHVSLLQLEEEVLSRHDEVSSPLRICRCRRSACHWLLGKFELPRVGVDVSNLGSAYHFFVPLLEVLNTSSMVFSELYLLR